MVLFLICLNTSRLHSTNIDVIYIVSTDTLGYSQEIEKLISSQNISSTDFSSKRPNPLVLLFKKRQAKNKKAVAAALAFPFPFGMVGLHRIYLGTAPYVPIVYIGTVGGGFGILPFIDFCVILLDKDITRYHENKKIFMWVND